MSNNSLTILMNKITGTSRNLTYENALNSNLIIVDCSGSMEWCFAEVLETFNNLNSSNFISFNHYVCYNRLQEPSGGTNLHDAFRFTKEHIPAHTRQGILLISDGLPSDTDKALEEALKLGVPISCIYIGNDIDGKEFLEKITALTKGRMVNIKDVKNGKLYLEQKVREVLQLPEPPKSIVEG